MPHPRPSTPIDPHRLRALPRTGFGWIDRRFVSQGFSLSLSAEANLLYFFLTAVADAKGLSYFGDRATADRLAITPGEIERARRELVAQKLVLFRAPLYQVLPLPASPSAPRQSARGGPPEHVAPAVKRVLRGALSDARERSTAERDPDTLE